MPVTSWLKDCSGVQKNKHILLAVDSKRKAGKDLGIDCPSISAVGSCNAGQPGNGAELCVAGGQAAIVDAKSSDAKSARPFIHGLRELSHVYFVEADPQYS